MCGPAINWLHSIIIGPIILVSTYYGLKLPLYIVGISAILVHVYYMMNNTSTEKLMKDANYKFLEPTNRTIPARA